MYRTEKSKASAHRACLMILKDGNRHREVVYSMRIAKFTRRCQENSKHGGEKDITTLIRDGSDFRHGSVHRPDVWASRDIDPKRRR